MKELHRGPLPDGSLDFGNGVIGPSLLDIQRANATLSSKNLRAQETRTKDNGDLIFVSSESKLGSSFKGVLRRVPKRFILLAAAVLSLVAAACSGGVERKIATLKNSKTKHLRAIHYPFHKEKLGF